MKMMSAAIINNENVKISNEISIMAMKESVWRNG
jgi:hypothetical protein